MDFRPTHTDGEIVADLEELEEPTKASMTPNFQLKGEQVQPVSSYLPPESRIFFSSIAVYSFAAVF